jgi:hypothetical protein
MKHLKRLGFVAASAALIAFIGTGSASATVLCSEGGITESCGLHGKVYAVGTVIKASLINATSSIIKNTGGEVKSECTTSTIEAKVNGAGGEASAVTAEVTSLAFNNCTLKPEVLKPGGLSITWIKGGDNGTVVSENAEITLLMGGLDCIYVPGDLGTLKGAAMATIEVITVLNRTAGSPMLCPLTMVWEAGYTVTAPEPLFVAKK